MTPQNKDYAAIKAGVTGTVPDTQELPEAPESEEAPETTYTEEEVKPAPAQETPQEQYYSGTPTDTERIHEIAEAIINERWEEFLARVGDLAVWKDRAETNLIAIKQEIIRINQRFENLQNGVLGKVKEYDQDMRDVHTEMKALEKVFEKISEPLVMNIKELGRITQELKRVK